MTKEKMKSVSEYKQPNTLSLSLAFAAGGLGTHADGDVITLAGVFRLDGNPTRVDDGEGILCLDVPLVLKHDVIAAAAVGGDLILTWA